MNNLENFSFSQNEIKEERNKKGAEAEIDNLKNRTEYEVESGPSMEKVQKFLLDRIGQMDKKQLTAVLAALIVGITGEASAEAGKVKTQPAVNLKKTVETMKKPTAEVPERFNLKKLAQKILADKERLAKTKKDMKGNSLRPDQINLKSNPERIKGENGIRINKNRPPFVYPNEVDSPQNFSRQEKEKNFLPETNSDNIGPGFHKEINYQSNGEEGDVNIGGISIEK